MNLSPLKTDKEKLVFRIIWKLSDQGLNYALIEAIQERVDLTKRSLSGILSSLKKKGWVYCFRDKNLSLDVEVTCMATKEFNGKYKNRFCNHQKCICNQ